MSVPIWIHILFNIFLHWFYSIFYFHPLLALSIDPAFINPIQTPDGCDNVEKLKTELK